MRAYVFRRWQQLSISKKLYGVIGVMAFLIIWELVVLWFAMSTLSAVRAFVGGEGLWSKAQKNAVLSLQSYALTRKESDFEHFLQQLKVGEGDRIARLELEKADPDLEVIRQGLIQGGNHPDDTEAMTKLLRRFSGVTYIRDAVEAWGRADDLLLELKNVGLEYHALLNSPQVNTERLATVVNSLRDLNSQLTVQEDTFSTVLGEGSRWMESVVITLLSLVVIMVECVGLALAFFTTRSLSRGLQGISSVAEAIGHGQFQRRVEIQGADEIAGLGTSINSMGEMLQKSYADLEARVVARTQALATAVKARDEFLSIASHELKTPLTTLSLQVEIRKRLLEQKNPQNFSPEKLAQMLGTDERQINRLTRLVSDMLDVSRLESKKMNLKKEEVDMRVLVRDVITRFGLNFSAMGCEIHEELPGSVIGQWDASRVEQILENLLSNAAKYGSGKPIHVRLWTENGHTKLSVQDHGMGIAPQDLARIFKPFERAVSEESITGLGLGLYIAHEIARMHGGKIEVVSEANVGSTFILTLPT